MPIRSEGMKTEPQERPKNEYRKNSYEKIDSETAQIK
jgi:hypothetical protein